MSGNLKPSDVMSLDDGMHGDGDYLWLRVKGNARSWIVRGPRDERGVKREAGLGAADRVSLSLARKERDKLVEAWRNGKDPIAARRAEREAARDRKTFAYVARLKIEAAAPGWRTSFEGRKATLDIWTLNMERDCAPIAHKPIDEIGLADIKRIVSPYWDRGAHKAGRDLIKRIEAVFDYAIAHGWRTSANPAAWQAFKHIWPAKPPGKEHHAALPWRDVPAFIKRLRASDAMTACVAEFTILTATRSGETRGARWAEFDLEAKTWTVPPDRMKNGEEHIVPLSDQAIGLLERVKAQGLAGEWVFPAYVNDGRRCERSANVPVPNAGVSQLIRRHGGVTLHGFRSTFRDWCGDHGIDRELAERSLAHKFGSAVESAYARSQLVARRAPIMQQWADFCDGKPSGDVLPFKRSA